jgi:hypothetical protein
MKRAGIVFLAVVAVLAMVAPDVSAQPKVTINGLIDNITSWSKNMNHEDSNPARTGDTEWYARMRVRPDITAEVGTTKFVLGLEIDYAFGQVGPTDGSFGGGGQKFGTLGGADQNTDIAGIIELKWAYTEFMLPMIPWATSMRVGAQPSAVMYKPAILQQGDFAGVHTVTTLAPMAKLHLTYVQIEEELTGARDGFLRGEDWAVFASVEITPFKGLDIRPIFSYAIMEGTTGQARLGRGGVANAAASFPNEVPGVNANAAREDRWTVGVDARWRFGAFSLDPTFMYQGGSRELFIGARQLEQRRSAWLADVRGGWQAGPLLLEGAVIYTSGNKASDAVDRGADMDFYEPISTDSGFYGGWAEIWALNIDYFNSQRPRAGGLNTITAIGYDKYGLLRLGARASYALTPAFTLRTAVTANWTAEDVDTASTLTNAGGLLPGDCTVRASTDSGACRDRGDASYLGTELNLGFQWRFAPNVAFDVVGSYMFSGNALATHTITGNTGGARNGRDPQDIQAVTARVRYTF